MSFDVDKDLDFRMVEQKPKTQVYEVWNLQQNFMIGLIKWYPSWRHYTFFPVDNTVFSDRCLIKIGSFIEELNLKHKEIQNIVQDSSSSMTISDLKMSNEVSDEV